MKLLYYAHRFRGPAPATQRQNLLEAQRRFADTAQWIAGTLWAPWLILAEHGVDESLAWEVIEAAIAASDGIVVDLDGGEWTDGLRRERDIAEKHGKEVVVIP